MDWTAWRGSRGGGPRSSAGFRLPLQRCCCYSCCPHHSHLQHLGARLADALQRPALPREVGLQVPHRHRQRALLPLQRVHLAAAQGVRGQRTGLLKRCFWMGRELSPLLAGQHPSSSTQAVAGSLTPEALQRSRVASISRQVRHPAVDVLQQAGRRHLRPSRVGFGGEGDGRAWCSSARLPVSSTSPTPLPSSSPLAQHPRTGMGRRETSGWLGPGNPSSTMSPSWLAARSSAAGCGALPTATAASKAAALSPTSCSTRPWLASSRSSSWERCRGAGGSMGGWWVLTVGWCGDGRAGKKAGRKAKGQGMEEGTRPPSSARLGPARKWQPLRLRGGEPLRLAVPHIAAVRERRGGLAQGGGDVGQGWRLGHGLHGRQQQNVQVNGGSLWGGASCQSPVHLRRPGRSTRVPGGFWRRRTGPPPGPA